jgi:hypothetical protein
LKKLKKTGVVTHTCNPSDLLRPSWAKSKIPSQPISWLWACHSSYEEGGGGLEDPILKSLKQKKKEGFGGMAEVVACVTSEHEALS